MRREYHEGCGRSGGGHLTGNGLLRYVKTHCEETVDCATIVIGVGNHGP